MPRFTYVHNGHLVPHTVSHPLTFTTATRPLTQYHIHSRSQRPTGPSHNLIFTYVQTATRSLTQSHIHLRSQRPLNPSHSLTFTYVQTATWSLTQSHIHLRSQRPRDSSQDPTFTYVHNGHLTPHTVSHSLTFTTAT